MKYSQLFITTLKEDPAEAEVVSHKLMYRAGLIRKLAAGIYTWLPAGLRTLRKVENIVREEMDRAGAQEVLMPAVQPAELWEESGRWDFYGKELLRFKDRHNRDCCMGPTHEEVITDLVRREVHSYRDMPVNLYQLQTKFRDEIRPRFGVMRSREFIMKDAYSFDADEDGAQASYQAMREAYIRIFERCGLEFVPVEADSGSIGGSFSHEFMVLADSGEDEIAACKACGYGANVEKAELATPEPGPGCDDAPGLERVETPDQKTIEEVAGFLKVEPSDLIKTLIFETDKGLVAVCVRGDQEVNGAKVKNLMNANTAELADEKTVREATGAPVGFAGPVGLELPVLADESLKGHGPFVVGGNENDLHLVNAVEGRDFKVLQWGDLRTIREGDGCPRCSAPIVIRRGIEVGHIFKLGTKYSEALKATYLDAEGKENPIVMGCYGIGVGRTMAAAIEQNHDENGIIWPVPIAPWEVLVLPVKASDAESMRVSEELAEKLQARGVSVLIDDRDDRAGVKFKDGDLIGIPLRITLGPRGLKEGVAEIKDRRTGEEAKVSLDETVNWVAGWVEERRML